MICGDIGMGYNAAGKLHFDYRDDLVLFYIQKNADDGGYIFMNIHGGDEYGILDLDVDDCLIIEGVDEI